MKVEIGKWGNSLAIRIPAPLAKDAGVEAGSELDATVDAGSIVLKPVAAATRRYALSDLVAAVSRENVHGETDWGARAGDEAW